MVLPEPETTLERRQALIEAGLMLGASVALALSGGVRLSARQPILAGVLCSAMAIVLAALAVLPTPRLEEYLAAGEDLTHISSLPTDVVRFRLKVHQEYQDLLTARQGV